MVTKAFRSLSRFASTRGTIAPRRHALAIFKPFDRHDNLNSTLNPFMMKRRGPDLFSLVCVPVDEKADTQYDGVSDEQFVSAASAADEGQMWFSGGNFHPFSMPIQHKDSQPRGGNEA